MQDLTKKTFGRLIVEGLSTKKPKNPNDRHNFWICRCECGNVKDIHQSSLLSGDTQSCGCIQKEWCRKNAKKASQIHSIKSNPQTALINCLLGKYKSTAVRRKIEFNLNKDVFIKLISSPCTYCGCEPFQEYKPGVYKKSLIYMGIDRVKNEIGYITENVVPCCKYCNIAKQQMNLQIFYKWICAVHARYLTNSFPK